MCDEYPQVVRDMVEAGWEIIGRGYHQRVLNIEPDQREVIRKTKRAIEAFSGRPKRGWMGPACTRPGIRPTYWWKRARVLCVSVHPYITGAAHRTGYFDQLVAWLKQQPDAAFFMGGGIVDWYKKETGLS
jgi:peptidoglycan/xylan/chitin deacetylase (PgdA/CDA1 family)